ncbi:uncharacterized protein N0V89_009856 [Didymosphaeria variabile]|uniref:MFS general substrate transporter n=1 Tax=Didymosphaeria variabile TaxID=1932322 RepID=A0A9W8XE50_9PLEO|nr:uncharacterized protein N0V89_009856 [Didymosphaeria variabile]KAJ4348481.1 hypothetical protein N0V89_009856 [Didymosphaeria variabile]
MADTNHELSSTKELHERPADAPSEHASESDIVHISPFALLSLMVGISLAAFLVALDRTIVANAIPYITNEFKSPDDAGWYGSAASLESLTTILLLLFFHPSKTNRGQEGSFVTRILRLDLIGNLILTATVVMLLLVLQWGGIEYRWGSSRIIGLLVASGVGFVLFGLWQHKKGAEALTPLSIMANRGVAASIGVMFFLSGAFLVHSYYLPYWFQAVRGRTPVQSGVDLTPYVATSFVFSMIAGIAVNKLGYFTPPTIIGCAIGCVGCGLLTTLHVDTSTATWAGYQVLTSAGMGMAMQQPIIAVQAILEPDLISIGSAIVLFAQGLSGAIFVSVANNVLRNELAQNLVKLRIPNVSGILAAGATDVRELVPQAFRLPLIEAYNDALSKVFIMAIPFCGIALLFALGLPWVSVKKKQAERGGQAVVAMEG